MQTAFVLLPAVLFFGAYKLYDIYIATACLMACVTLLTIIEWIRTRKANKLHLVSTALLLVLGSITLVLRDPEFLQWKFTVYHWVIAAVLIWTQKYGEKTGLQSFFETIGKISGGGDSGKEQNDAKDSLDIDTDPNPHADTENDKADDFDLSKLPAHKYRLGNLASAAYFFLVGVINLYVAFRMSEAAWVNFKVFGITIMNFVFMIGLMVWLFRGEFSTNETS